MRHLLVTLLFFLSSGNVQSTHLIGGELYYECLGNNQWAIGISMFRDCNVQVGQGATAFDSTLFVSVYQASNSQLLDVRFLLPSTIEYELPFILGAPCMADTPNVCVTRLDYRDTFALEIPPGGVYLVNQRCCRTDDAINLQSPSDDFGSTYSSFIPDSSIALCNNSARFNQEPPKLLCLNLDLGLDYSASDIDGDSLVYNWCDPFHGGGRADGNGVDSPIPNTPAPPPFTSVVWSTGFATTYQIPSSPAMNINTNTGIINGAPNQLGTFISGVCVSEYRNGIKINENRRDFQLTTAICDVEAIAIIDSTIDKCVGLEVDFFSMSSLADRFLWDFGDTVLNDTSSLVNPKWLFSDTGTYTIQLIAIGSVCNDTTEMTYNVLPRIEPLISHSEPECFDRHIYQLIPQGYFKTTTNMYWNLNLDTYAIISDSFGLKDIRFETAGNYPVQLTYEDFGCIKTIVDTLTVWPNPEIKLTAPNGPFCIPYSGKYSLETYHAHKPFYLWLMDSNEVSITDSLFVELNMPGEFDLFIEMRTDSLCIDTVSIYAENAILVLDTPASKFSFVEESVGMFDNNMNPYFIVNDSSEKALYVDYFIEDSLVSEYRDFEISVKDTGDYYLTQIATHMNGCMDTSHQKFRLEPEYLVYIPNSFTPDGDGINDTWLPRVYVEDEYDLDVYDRWGNVVFSTQDSKLGWIGSHQNDDKECPLGVYGYLIRTIDNTGKSWKYEGTVTLLR